VACTVRNEEMFIFQVVKSGTTDTEGPQLLSVERLKIKTVIEYMYIFILHKLPYLKMLGL